MATEEAGLELFVDGEDEFNSALEDANSMLESLGETAEKISGTLDSASSGLEDADSALGQFSEAASGAGEAFDAAGEIIIGGLRRIGEIAVDSLLAAGAAFVGFAKDSFQGALDSEEAIAKLNSTIKATGGVAGVTSEKAQGLASSLAKVTKFSDDATLEAETLLLTFTNIGSETFPRATETLLDMATIMGTDAKSGAIQLGKALNDPAEGLTALTRVGVTFTEEQKKQVEQMMKVGNIAGAQGVILDELQREFGGAAKAAGETFAGKLEILKNRLSEVGEGVAGAFIPIINQMLSGLMPAVAVVEDLANAFSTFVTELAQTGDLTGALDTLMEFDSVRVIFSALGISGEEFYTATALIGTAFDNLTQSISNGTPILQVLSDTIKTLSGIDIAPEIYGISSAFDNLSAHAQPVILAAQNLQAAFLESMPQIRAAVDVALNYIQSIWNIVFPSIQATTNNTLTQIATLTANILNSIANFWEIHGDTVIATVTFFIEAASSIIGGALALISGLVSAFLSALNGDWDAAGQALQNSTTAFMEAILSIIGTNLESVRAVWSDIFTNLHTIVSTQIQAAADAFQAGMDAIQAAGHEVGSYINALLDSFKSFYDWLSSHVFSFNIQIPDLPEWAIPGSPTPFEIGLRGIDKALQAVTPNAREFASSINLLPPDTAVTPPASASQITRQSVYNSSSSNSLTINAQYPMQSARSIGDDVRMWTMLTGNAA